MAKDMKLTELLNAIGDDNILFQNLDMCITQINKKKRENQVTFVTEQSFNAEGMTKIGLVVWLDRETVAHLMKEEK